MALPANYRPLTIPAGIHAVARRLPRKTAVTEGARSLTYAELDARIHGVAFGLLADGLRSGDRVALLAPSCLEFVEIACGIAAAGLVAVTLNPRLHARELREVLDDAGPHATFVHPSLEPLAREAGAGGCGPVRVIGDDYEPWRDRPRRDGRLPAITEFDPFMIVYTSGTTGRAKGVVLPHRARALLFHAKAMEYGCYGPDDRHLGVAPMGLGAGFGFGTCALYFGGHLEILGAFDPEHYLHRLSEGGATGVFVVPTHLQAIFELPDSVLARYRHLPALRTIISNAAALPQALKQRTVEQWGEGRLHETYGFTEAGVVTNLRPEDQLRKPGSCGRPFAGACVRLLDDDGRDVPAGQVGELYVSSPYLFNEYWRRPEETASCTRDGWLTAGDLARADEDGCLYVVDRRKDMVVTGGMNVYPREIETRLLEHPGVRDAAVVGVPDVRWGERLCAFVVADSASVAPAALESFCRGALAGYKVPRDYRYVDALPRNSNGKVLKRELRVVAQSGVRP
jgi:long-chain acyl-CoA synthetase